MVFGPGPAGPVNPGSLSFNSLWELDGVRTIYLRLLEVKSNDNFQFPVGIRWCSDSVGVAKKIAAVLFQFPVGIRWCSDIKLLEEREASQGLSIPCGN